MPLINVQPRDMQDGTRITYFNDSVGTSSTTYTFATNQEMVMLRNKGSRDISYTIGASSGVLGRGELIKVNGSFSSVVLSSSQGTQAFEIISDEIGTVSGSADYTNLASQVAERVKTVNGVAPDASGNVTISGGGGAATLDGLTDVDTSTTAPSEGNVLKYIGGVWKPSADIVGSGGGGGTDVMNVYNAKQHGLLGDGSTSDNVAFNTLIQTVADAGGGIIYCPEGTYMLDDNVFLKSNVSIYGAGIGKTNFAFRRDVSVKGYGTDGTKNDAKHAFTWDRQAATQPSSTNPFVNMHFRDFTIDGSGIVNMTAYRVGVKGFYIQFLRDCSFKNIYIHDTVATGLGIDFLDRVVIENVHAYNCGRGFGVMTGGTLGGAGIGIGTGGMASENFIINSCIADGCGSYGIFTEDQSIFDGTYTYQGQGVIISNCIVKNTRNYGFGVKGGKGITISNCQSYNNTKHGIYVSAVNLDGLVITNNVMYGNVISGIYFDMTASKTLTRVKISDNIIFNNTSDAITFFTGIITDVDVTNNIVEGNLTFIQFKNGCTFDTINIAGNLVKGNIAEGIIVNSGISSAKNLFVDNNKFINNSASSSSKYAVNISSSVDGGSIAGNIAKDTNATKKQGGGLAIVGAVTFSNARVMYNDFRFNTSATGYNNVTASTLTTSVNDIGV